MDLIKLSFDPLEVNKIKYDGNIIEVRPWMTYAEQTYLIARYIKNYLFPENGGSFIESSRHDTFSPDIVLMQEILKLYTNIEIPSDEQGNSVFDIDGFMSSGLWEKIKSAIENYQEFEQRLYQTLEDTKEQVYHRESVGTSIDLIASKVSTFVDTLISFLDKMSQISPEDVEKLKSTGKELLADIEKSEVGQIFKEASMNNAASPNVQTKTVDSGTTYTTTYIAPDEKVIEPAPKTKRGRKPKNSLVQ